MKVKRYFHIRVHGKAKKFNGATVVVTGNTDDPAQVDVQFTLCSKRDMYCKKTGRSIAETCPTKVVMLRYLPRELARIEDMVYGVELDNKQDFLFAVNYFLPKE